MRDRKTIAYTLVYTLTAVFTTADRYFEAFVKATYSLRTAIRRKVDSTVGENDS